MTGNRTATAGAQLSVAQLDELRDIREVTALGGFYVEGDKKQ